jgi:hypothetical protein
MKIRVHDNWKARRDILALLRGNAALNHFTLVVHASLDMRGVDSMRCIVRLADFTGLQGVLRALCR